MAFVSKRTRACHAKVNPDHNLWDPSVVGHTAHKVSPQYLHLDEFEVAQMKAFFTITNVYKKLSTQSYASRFEEFGVAQQT